MLKFTIVLLLFELLIGSSNSACVRDVESCSDASVCYTKRFDHKEGRIESSGCISSLDYLHSKICLDALNVTSADVCIDEGSHRICCCTSADPKDACNNKWVTKSTHPYFTTTELCCILLAWCFATFPFEICRRYINKVSRDNPTRLLPETTTRLTQLEKIMSSIVLVTLLCIHSSMWFPISFSCSDHPEGKFSRPNRFLLQIFEHKTFSLMLGWMAMLITIFELYRVFAMVWKPLISRSTFTVVYCCYSFWLIPLLVQYAFELKKIEQLDTTENYCKMGRSIWQIEACACMVGIYFLEMIIREFIAVCLYTRGEEPEDERRVKVKDIPLNTTLSSTIETAFSNTSIREDEHVLIQPKPFTLDLNGEALLTIHNNQSEEWIALRVLVSAPRHYSIHPSKVVLPPTRTVSISVRRLKCSNYPPGQHGLMIEWFGVGSECPSQSPPLLWTRPYFRPRSVWSFYVLPIYHEGTFHKKNDDETDMSAIMNGNIETGSIV